VDTTSPGSRVNTLERNSINAGTPKIRWRVLDDCMISPFRVSFTSSACGSPISSAVAIQGPMGAKVSKVLPMIHWLVAI
jgi:hypothetical protein